MKKYDAYKDSGIEWLREIPNKWDIVKLKHVVESIETGKTPSTSNDLFFENGSIDWYSPGDFTSLKLQDANRKITKKAVEDYKLTLYPKDTILLIGIGATLGKVAIVDRACYSNQQINAIIPSEKINSIFALYYLDSIKDIIRNESSSSTMAILNQSKTKDLILVLPSPIEQAKIAQYLDHKTTKIDTLIEKKEQLVEKLTLKRKAIINEAVTKGLNPDVPMKDSGIEWLGEIPEHWEVVSLKYLVNHSTTKGDGKSELKVALENIESQTGIYLESEKKEFEGELKEFKKDDILFNKLRPYLAKVFKAPEDGECVSELLVFTCLSPVLIPDFLFWKLISQQVISVVDSSTYGAKMPRVGTDFMLNLPIALPLKEEQEEIIKHITNKIKVIDDTSGKAKESIEKLKLYRQSLISEAVTGKIDLRDWEQPSD